MCREGDFPPYEEWNRNGGVASDSAVDPVPGGDVDGGLGVQQGLVSCECGGIADAPNHLVSLLHLAMVNRKRDAIEDWPQRGGWLALRRRLVGGTR
jgi:hypothetical protein